MRNRSKCVKPALGKRPLQDMTPVQIQQFVNHLINRKDVGKRLSPKTVKDIHGVLHSALRQAVRIGYLKANPASLTILPRRIKSEITPLQDDLGHYSAAFTLDVYGHVTEQMRRDSSERMGRYIEKLAR